MHELEMPKIKQWLVLDRFDRAVLAATAVILFCQLIVPPIIGLADNGDFDKILGLVGLKHAAMSYEERFFHYINSQFLFAEPGWYASGYLTSETLIIWVARAIGSLVSKDGVFDIRIVGELQAIILLFSLALVLSAARGLQPISRRVLALLLVVMFTDVGYVSLLNSFYSQTASFLFLLVAAGLAALMISERGENGWTF